MMSAEEYSHEISELLRLLMEEERNFHARSRQMRIDDAHLVRSHELTFSRVGRAESHERMRLAHEAMFKVHRKLKKEHDEAIRRSLAVVRQAEQGKYSTEELAGALEQLQHQLQRIREEHSLMEKERKQILLEHEEWIRKLGEGFSH